MHIFEVIDKKGRTIYLTPDRWTHIVTRHPELSNSIETIKQIVLQPLFIVDDNIDSQIKYYHHFFKEIKMYLIVAVKYINRAGFVITAFYSKNRKK